MKYSGFQVLGMSFTRILKTSAYELAAIYELALLNDLMHISLNSLYLSEMLISSVFSFLWLVHTESPLSSFSN